MVSDRIAGSGSPDLDVAIIGAGPYGLSAGAHLKARGSHVRIFGKPMDFWEDKMPAGMLLRSPRVASNLSDPRGEFTLDAFEAASGRTPTAPVSLETFVAYGHWFRQQLAAEMDFQNVALVRREGSNFQLVLDDGSTLRSRRVVVAAGIGNFQRKPAVFAPLSREQASHCYEGRKIADLAGKRIAVIGAGQSALESAALLHEAGSDVEVIAQIQALRWLGQHSWLHKLGPVTAALYSKHDIGPVGISRLVAMPHLVSHIPMKLRDKIRVRAVRPIGAKWLRSRLATVKISTGKTVQAANSTGNEVHLKLDDGTERRVDHVLMGTGYDVDITRYEFLCPDLISSVRRLGGYPDLDPGFCSSVPGLYFVGAPAARTFGPLVYFVTGTEFTSRVLTSHIVAEGSLRAA